jgi:hypothetical protein
VIGENAMEHRLQIGHIPVEIKLETESGDKSCGFEHIAKIGPLTVTYSGHAGYPELTPHQVAQNEWWKGLGYDYALYPVYPNRFRYDWEFSRYLTVTHDDAVDTWDSARFDLGKGVFDEYLLTYAIEQIGREKNAEGNPWYMARMTDVIAEFWTWIDERREHTVYAPETPDFGASEESWTQRKDVVAVITRNRDSSKLDDLNFDFFYERFQKLDPDGDDVRYKVERFGHWAAGWLETLFILKDDNVIGREAKRMREKMDGNGYPAQWVEDQLSEYEAEELDRWVREDAEYLTDWFPEADEQALYDFLDEHVGDSSFGMGDDYVHYDLRVEDLIEEFGPIDPEWLADHQSKRGFNLKYLMYGRLGESPMTRSE